MVMYYILQIDDENNEHNDNAPDTTNKSIACVPAQRIQRKHTSGEDSEIPIKEPTECSTVSQKVLLILVLWLKLLCSKKQIYLHV